MWDEDNMEKSGDAQHDSLNMAALQMSRRFIFFYIHTYHCHFIFSVSGLILLGVIMLLSIIKLLAAYFHQFYNYYKKSKSKQPKGAPKMLHFGELLCFFACLLPSITRLSITMYFYYVNQYHCPSTFFKYSMTFCECDFIERRYPIQYKPTDFELNSMCNNLYDTDILYVDSKIIFSRYLPRKDSSKNGCIKCSFDKLYCNDLMQKEP